MFARSGLPAFQYVRAVALDEAIGFLGGQDPTARALMGGTDLFPAMREGKLAPRIVVDVKHLPGMCEIAYDRDSGLAIGAGVTMNGLAWHPDVRAHYPLLAQAAQAVASYQIRNRATIGGNLCNASPCADTAPALLALNGEIELYGPDGGRTVAAHDFFTGPGSTVLRQGELMIAIRIPPLPTRAAGRYLKLGRCRTGDLSLVGVAVLGLADAAGTAYRFRIGLGSVAPTPIRAEAAEAFLAAHPPGEETFVAAAERAMEAARPISDVRGTAEYQKAMVRTLTLRGLREAWVALAGEE